eukprot:421402_1
MTANLCDSDTSNDCSDQKTFSLPLMDKTFTIPPNEIILYAQILSMVFSIFNAISNSCLRRCAACALENNSSGKCARRCLWRGDRVVWIQFFVAVSLATAVSILMWSKNEFTLFMLNFAAGRIWSLVFAYFKMK